MGGERRGKESVGKEGRAGSWKGIVDVVVGRRAGRGGGGKVARKVGKAGNREGGGWEVVIAR